MSQNYKIIIQYEGTRYDGWQKQGNTENTIQGKLEKVLERLTDSPLKGVLLGAAVTAAKLSPAGWLQAGCGMDPGLSEPVSSGGYCHNGTDHGTGAFSQPPERRKKDLHLPD